MSEGDVSAYACQESGEVEVEVLSFKYRDPCSGSAGGRPGSCEYRPTGVDKLGVRILVLVILVMKRSVCPAASGVRASKYMY